LTLLRFSIAGVTIFSFFFSLFFPMRDFIYMYQLITGAIYLGGSGAVIIGGLYWKRGTTAGAWSSLITGATIALCGAILRTVNPEFPLNGAWMALIASLSAITMYVAVSLATSRGEFDLDQMLHRGKYALPGEHRKAPHPHPLRWLGINEEFTRGDKFIYFAKIGWTGFWFLSFVAGTILALTRGISNAEWGGWWHFTVILGMAVGGITIVWFLWGGIRDLREMLVSLRTLRRDADDDGTVAPQDHLGTPDKRNV